MNYPKITIVTPSYNQGDFLEATILSVLGQGYPNLEYIIMDGGSTDNSIDVIMKYQDKLSYWCSEKDNGSSQAINKGFSMATGEILAWINSDDIFMPQSLFLMAFYYLSSEKKDILFFGNCIHFEESPSGVISHGSDVAGKAEKYDLNICDYIIQPSSFWSKSIWEKIGPLNENLNYAFDWEWFLRAKDKKINFKPLSKVLSLYRIHDSHKTSIGGQKRQAEIIEIYKRFSTAEIADLYKSIIIDLNVSVKRSLLMRVKRMFIRKFYTRIDEISFLKKYDKKYKNYSNYTLEGLYNMK